MSGLRALFSALADLVVPVVCLLCGELDAPLCGSCSGRLRVSGSVHRVVPVPGYPALAVHGSLAAGPELLRLITAFKDSGRSDLAPLLGGLMTAHRPTLTEAGIDVVVAVPQSRRAYIRRGWDPVATLARAAGYSLSRALEVHARHVDQTTLTREARWQNVSQTMRVTGNARALVRGRRFLAVDDVITTGATFAEVARARYVAGARDVRGVALASVQRSSQQTHR